MAGRIPNAIDRHVAAQLRLLRLGTGLTQVSMADAIGISVQQVQKYEGGANRMSAGVLFQLAQTLDISVLYFFDGLSSRDERADSNIATWQPSAENTEQTQGSAAAAVVQPDAHIAGHGLDREAVAGTV
jgi:transcriptional regulator with XRE-family HTH domain